MQTIYCVEDDESIRELILCALRSGGFTGVGFSDGESMFDTLSTETPPALFLLDIMLPGEDGTAILRRLRASTATAETPILMLTAKGAEYDKVNALDSGADDYIVKPFGVMELLSRIRAVLRRSEPIPEATILTCKTVSLSLERREVLVDNTPCTLTHKEFELLCYLLKNQGLVLTRTQMMDAVWGFDFEGESRTVDMHIKTLRQKLSAAGAPEMIKTVRSVGYKLEDDR